MQIIQKSHHVKVESYSLAYEWKDTPGAGYSFPCDQDGNILDDQMGREAWKSYRECQNNSSLIPLGVRNDSYTYLEHAKGKCSCGRAVDLTHFTNECECGLLYNLFGQGLAPRSQWDPRGEY